MSLKITEIIQCNKFSYSFEITQEITDTVLNSFMTETIIGSLEPIFYSVTWHAQTHQCKNQEITPMKVAKKLRQNNKNVLLHLSCHMLSMSYLENLLRTLRHMDVCNLFVTLGENFDPSTSDFKSTQDLIKYIRQETGDDFCIGVAGFPGRDDKLFTLKEKVDSGADFILTQAFFEYDIFKEFLLKCKSVGIMVPIIPGMFTFETEFELTKFANLCKVNVTERVIELLKIESGISLVEKMILDIVKDGHVNHFHFFTLNNMLRVKNLITKIRGNPKILI